LQVTAVDDDVGQNGLIDYYIVSGNQQSAFDISPSNTGVVRTNIILDREVRDSYRLEIAARDRGNPQRSATVVMRIQVIDVNDNSPFFPPYYPISIHEGNNDLVKDDDDVNNDGCDVTERRAKRIA
jgi:protocadherin-16/23